jgi:hypothetical protein
MTHDPTIDPVEELRKELIAKIRLEAPYMVETVRNFPLHDLQKVYRMLSGPS